MIREKKKRILYGICVMMLGFFILLQGKTKVEAATQKGLDVSVWQGTINWKTIKQEGYQFALIRVGHGNHNLDSQYKRNMTEAANNGIPAGAYFYSTATSEEQSVKDAQWVIQNLQGYKVSYPVVIDMEDSGQLSLTRTARSRIALAFCNEIKAAGYYPMIYCNTNWYDNYLNMSTLSGIDIWLARYGSKPSTSSYRYSIWQYTSSGVSAGITVNTVDQNYGYVDYTQKITPRTSAVSCYTGVAAKWVKDTKGWRYRIGSSSYVTNSWRKISGSWYYFDSSGYMATNWKKISGIWYYFGGSSDGAMKTGWRKISNVWYYFNSSGAMKTGWQKTSGIWYYLRSSGAMVTSDWVASGGNWYYMNGSGAMVTSKWIKDDNIWYYLNSDGTMRRSKWLSYQKKWYYLQKNGAMKTGWLKLGTVWYYLDSEGVMLTGWKKYAGAWYYMDTSGKMVTSQTLTISGQTYQFAADGKWIS